MLDSGAHPMAADGQTNLVSSTQDLKLSPESTKKTPATRTSFVPPCKVCNAAASGYHYGANTCEACKAFFRRSIGKEDSIKPCLAEGNCAENPDGRITCSDCRHKKCLRIGMAKNSVKLGRYTYKKRTQDTKEIRRLQADEVVNRKYELELCDETLTTLTHQFIKNFPMMKAFWDAKPQIDLRIEEMLAEEQLKQGEPLRNMLYSPGHSPSLELRQRYETVREHLFNASSNAAQSSISNLFADKMIFEEWAFQADAVCHGLTGFAMALPGFADLPLDDRVVLLKRGNTECLNVVKHQTNYPGPEAKLLYYEESGDLLLLPMFFLRRSCGEDFIKLLLKATKKLQKLNLTTEDMAVFLAFIILTPDREGLQQSELVSKLQDKMLTVLQYSLSKNHPDNPKLLADTLLVVSFFRELTELHESNLEAGKSLIRPDVHPLLAEIVRV